jgi:hypothetical protein
MFKETGIKMLTFRLFVPKSMFEAEKKMRKDLQKNVPL